MPGTADDATLTSGTYTVTEDISTNVNSLTIPNSSVTFTVASNSVFNTLGAINFSGGTINAAGSINCGGLSFTGGTINGPGAISLSGSNSWGGGIFQSTAPGTLTVLSGATLNFYGGNYHELPGWILNNNGTNLHTGEQVRGGLGTVINNNGLWVEEADNYLYNSFGGTATFANNGTFRKAVTTGTTIIGGGSAFVFDNLGLVDAQSGTIVISGGGTNSGAFNADTNAEINFGGSYTFNDGSAFTGTGNNYLSSGTFTLNGSITSTNPANLQWSGGEFAGVFTLSAGSTLNMVGGNYHDMPGVIMTNNGTILHPGNQFRGGSGTVIYNNGLWLEESDNYLYNPFGGVATLVNTGTYRKIITTGTTIIGGGSAFVFNNLGLVDAQSGTIIISGGGTNSGTFNAGVNGINNFGAAYAFEAGTLFTGAGVNTLTGGILSFNGSAMSSNLVINGASITGSGVITLLGTSTF